VPAGALSGVRLPGRSGLDFRRELSTANIHVSIIFITGHGDIQEAQMREPEMVCSGTSAVSPNEHHDKNRRRASAGGLGPLRSLIAALPVPCGGRDVGGRYPTALAVGEVAP
jgi:hypothetical protein